MDALNAQAGLPAAGENPPEWDGKDVAELLGLASISDSRFRTRCAETNEHGRIYGGQILAQALSAASETVSGDRFVSCLQLVFAAGGLPDQAIDFEVATLQEGKRFSARNVRGLQRAGRILCDASVTFAKPLESPAHEAPPSSNCGLDRDPEVCPALEDIDAPGVTPSGSTGSFARTRGFFSIASAPAAPSVAVWRLPVCTHAPAISSPARRRSAFWRRRPDGELPP
jgi:acyl-CoA thioesterase